MAKMMPHASLRGSGTAISTTASKRRPLLRQPCQLVIYSLLHFLFEQSYTAAPNTWIALQVTLWFTAASRKLRSQKEEKRKEKVFILGSLL